MPSTSRGKHSVGAGKPAGKSRQGDFSIIGWIGKKLLTRRKKSGWSTTDAPKRGRYS